MEVKKGLFPTRSRAISRIMFTISYQLALVSLASDPCSLGMTGLEKYMGYTRGSVLARPTSTANHRVVLRRRAKNFLRPKPIFCFAKNILNVGGNSE